MRRLHPSPADDIDLYEAYAIPATPASRHVRVNFVSSVDGAVEVGGRSGPLSGRADRRVFSVLRTLADVIVVGAGTVRAEGYGPARPGAERVRRRLAAGLNPVPPIAVLTSHLDLDLAAPFFTAAQARPLVFTTEAAPPQRRAAAEPVADVLVLGETRVDLPAAVATLVERGLPRVLCEGGPTVFRDLLAADLVDELCLTVAPQLTGSGHARLIGGPALPGGRPLALGQVLEEDATLFLRYQRG